MHDVEAEALFQTIRSEIKHEDDLIGQRVSWFTASQAFLLTALAIANQGETRLPSPTNNALFPLIPVVALASSVLIFFGVLAGIAALFQWRTRLKTLAARYPEAPRLHREGWIMALGWTVPIALPLVFIIAWLYLLVQGYAAP
jgi:uncharacterized integral membrane protein